MGATAGSALPRTATTAETASGHGPSQRRSSTPAASASSTGATQPVTVVVMTRDRWPDLQRSLPRHEAPVILVDNGSTDGTPRLVREHFPHIDVIELGSNHGSTARNIGVGQATTPYVAFADDDSWWAPGALAEATAVLDAHPRLAVLAGRILVGEEERPDTVCALMEHSPLGTDDDLPGPSVLGFLACAAIVRRAAYLDAGGFDDIVFFMGEEERLALDLMTRGWGLSYVEGVVAHHYPSLSRDSVQRRTRAARNRLLTTVLRRPLPVVLQVVTKELRGGRAGWLAVGAALRVLPRALSARRVVPPHVEAARRRLDHPSRETFSTPR